MATTPPPRALTREIARVVKGRMSSYEITQAEMAAMVGVDQSQLSKMIRGLKQITVDQLDIMCHMLGLELVKVVSDAKEFVDARDWPGEPWILPYVLDGIRVVGEAQTEPDTISNEDDEKVRAELALAAKNKKPEDRK